MYYPYTHTEWDISYSNQQKGQNMKYTSEMFAKVNKAYADRTIAKFEYNKVFEWRDFEEFDREIQRTLGKMKFQIGVPRHKANKVVAVFYCKSEKEEDSFFGVKFYDVGQKLYDKDGKNLQEMPDGYFIAFQHLIDVK